MFNFLRRKIAASTAPDPSARVPEGTRVYAIGDIHGQLDMLDALLERIRADDAARNPAETHLILLGDLVDRGADSKGVVERVRAMTAANTNVRCLFGNHEEVFLLALGGNLEALKLFSRIGGRETMLSYGLGTRDFMQLPNEDLLVRIRELVPPEHVAFLETLPNWIEMGDYLFVHAGLRPGIPLEEQKVADLRWIRNSFLNSSEDHGRTVVHGHTVSVDVEERSNRIGIDTGAVMGGKLTALGLDGGERWYVTVDATEVGALPYQGDRS